MPRERVAPALGGDCARPPAGRGRAGTKELFERSLEDAQEAEQWCTEVEARKKALQEQATRREHELQAREKAMEAREA